MRLTPLLFLTCCALLTPAFAWATTGPPPYFERHLNVRDGLSNNAIVALHQDNLGFLWIGTRDGLNRFDGYQFIPFLNKASGHLCSGTVFSITETRDGRLWVATSEGVAYLSPGTEHFVCRSGTDLGLGSGMNTIFDLTVTSGNRVWASTAKGLLSLVHSGEHNLDVTLHPLPSGMRITRLEPHSDGSLWLGEQHGMLYHYRPESKTLDRVPQPELGSGTNLYALQTDQSGSLWLIGQALLRRYDTRAAQWHTFQFPRGRPAPLLVTADLFSEPSPVFYAGSGEAYTLDDSGKQLVAQPSADLRNSGSIRLVYRTSGEHLWIGSMESGLTQRQANRNQFATLWDTVSDLQEASLISGLAATSDGKLVVGTLYAPESGQSGIHVVDPETGDHLNLGALIPAYGQVGSPIFAIERSHYGADRFFISTHRHGIIDVTLGPTPLAATISLPDTLAQIQAVAHVDSLTLLLGSRKGSLYAYNLESRTLTNVASDTPLDGRTRVVRLHSVENAWYASFDDRLYRFDPVRRSKELITFSDEGTLPGFIYDVQADPEGRTWIASESGLHQVQNAKGNKDWKLTAVSALGAQAIQTIAFDDTSALWLVGSSGAYRFQPDTQSLQAFTEVDGLPTFERSSILKTVAQTPAGFFFGTDSHGVLAANMAPPPSPETQPSLQITTFTSRGLAPQYFAQHDTLRFAFRDKAFAFEFALLNFNIERGQQYEYRLSPFEDTWQHAETRRYASYTNLPPGNYTLQIRAQDASGAWSALPLAKTIVITPPWYRTAQAYFAFALVLIGLGMLVFWAIKQRHKREIALLHREAELVEEKRLQDAVAHQRLQAVDALRRTFLENMSHELRTPLAGVIAAGDILAYEDLGELNEIVEIIQESGGRLEKTLLSILDFSAIHTLSELVDLETFDLGIVLQEVYLNKAPEARAKQLEMHLAPPTLPIRLHTSKHYLTEVLNHVLDNAIKFTEAGKVEIEVENRSDVASVIIRDTGIGMQGGFEVEAFAPFRQESSGTNRQFEGCGLGLSIAKHALLLMDGDIVIETKKGQGTTVRVTLPLLARQAAPEPVKELSLQPIYYSKAS